jgi:hypothetical protein
LFVGKTMNANPVRYIHTWKAKPLIMLLVSPFVAGLAYGAFAPDTPWPLRLLLGTMSIVAFLAGLVALMTTTAMVNTNGVFELHKKITVLPFTTLRFEPGELLGVELDRHMSASGPSGVTGTGSRSTPRFRIDLRHTNGTLLVISSADGTDLEIQAKRLAEALNCPLKRVGVW